MVFMSSCVSLMDRCFYQIYKRKINEYYRLESINDMISAGLHLTDLNLFDSTSDLLITGIHQEQELEATNFRVSFIIFNLLFSSIY